MNIIRCHLNNSQQAFSLLLFLLITLAGCSFNEPSFPVTRTLETSAKQHGQDVAQDLTNRYNNKAVDCGAATLPAFLCSGVMLRSTSGNTGKYHSWNPSPASVKSGGVSFSYLRADAKFKSLVFGQTQGFIFYPAQSAPTEKIVIQVLCVYPIDSGTDLRTEQQECADHPWYPIVSRECQSQGILTAAQWYAHYSSETEYPRLHQCGFNVRQSLAEQAVSGFNAALQGMSLISTPSLSIQNELRLATWDQDIGGTLPLQAFFYVNGGLSAAQFDQRDFYTVTGIMLPIIYLTLPTSSAGEATFAYRESDQIEIPTDDKIKPSVLETYNIEGDHLRMSDIYDATHITVEIPEYEGINGGKDTIRVYWTGRVNYISSIITAANPPAKTEILIPRSEVIDNIGRSVNVKYSVKENGIGDTKESASLILYIDPQAVDPLPPPTYSDSTVSTNYAGETGDTIKLRWAGTTTHDTATQNVIPGKPNTFSIPSDWIAENAGKEVLINYSIKRNSTGSNLMFSQILRMTMP